MAESYDALEEKMIDIKGILSFHVFKILQRLNRRITFKEKFKNPWIVEVGKHPLYWFLQMVPSNQ